MAMKMSKVMDCKVDNCAYNKDMACHTMAITIGDGTEPMCDTFLTSSIEGGDMDTTASVGACKVDGCTFNEKLECCSPEIHIDMLGTHPDCTTFTKR